MLCENVIDTIDLRYPNRFGDTLGAGNFYFKHLALIGDHSTCLLSVYGSSCLFQLSPFRLRYFSLYTQWLLVAGALLLHRVAVRNGRAVPYHSYRFVVGFIS